MKIKREIHGETVEIELTKQELFLAYEECQFKFDQDTVKDMVCGWSDERFNDVFGVDSDTFMKLSEDIACEMRRNIDKYGLDMDYARDEAVRDVISAYKRDKRE